MLIHGIAFKLRGFCSICVAVETIIGKQFRKFRFRLKKLLQLVTHLIVYFFISHRISNPDVKVIGDNVKNFKLFLKTQLNHSVTNKINEYY